MSTLVKRIARLFLRINGWEAEGGRPVERSFVLVAAPHTSNWDLPYLLAFGLMYDIRISWMGKHTLFRGPMGWIMRALGGIPVRRDRRNNLVDQMAEQFAARDDLVLVIPPEGTRSYAAHWKSGFYRIAERANVPLVLSFLDYERCRGGFGTVLVPSGDLREDMDQVRAFYADKKGKFPDQFGPVLLKEEQ